ncbi:hypothetical protein [Campylobacter sp.]|uniref:hypothetical protein n=1 Tax=Campylobacter sp. TaxID=205 RepID=UPI002A81CC8E|nr:hypothetical protein [Campylobacter sp.]MDY4803043.1 hypothetical protein [Campylobacter sp.]
MSKTNCYQSLKAQSFTSLSLVWLRQLEDRIYNSSKAAAVAISQDRKALLLSFYTTQNRH